MLKKLFGIDINAKVNSAHKQSETALGMFAKANQRIEKVNAKLKSIADKAREDAQALIDEANRAESVQLANKNVQDKLKDFIPAKV